MSKVKDQSDRTCFRVGGLFDHLQVDFVTQVLVIHAFVKQRLNDQHQVVVVQRRCPSHFPSTLSSSL